MYGRLSAIEAFSRIQAEGIEGFYMRDSATADEEISAYLSLLLASLARSMLDGESDWAWRCAVQACRGTHRTPISQECTRLRGCSEELSIRNLEMKLLDASSHRVSLGQAARTVSSATKLPRLFFLKL